MPTMHRSGYVRRPKPIFRSILLVSMWLLFAFANVRADDKLVLVSPHWEGIQREFETAFKSHYLRETGRTVELEWMDAGGTSEVLRFIRSEFKAKPAGIGIDIFFGGGLDPYLALKQEDLLEPYALPQPLLEKIPPRLGGVPLYDPDHTWYGATLSGFGIIYNKIVLKLTHLPLIRTWEDLALPVAFGWVVLQIRARAAAFTWRTRSYCRHTAGIEAGRFLRRSEPTCAISQMRQLKSPKMWPSGKLPTGCPLTFSPGHRLTKREPIRSVLSCRLI